MFLVCCVCMYCFDYVFTYYTIMIIEAYGAGGGGGGMKPWSHLKQGQGSGPWRPLWQTEP